MRRTAQWLFRPDHVLICLRVSLRICGGHGGTTSAVVRPYSRRSLTTRSIRPNHRNSAQPTSPSENGSVSSSETARWKWRTQSNDQTSAIQDLSGHDSLANESEGTLKEIPRSIDILDGESALWNRIDTDQHRNDFDTWLRLAQTRQLVYGTDGLRLVWKTLVERDIDLPTTGRHADELWSRFLALGFKDPKILSEILWRARKQRVSSDRAWPNLYVTVLSHYFREQHNHVRSFHIRLYKHFPPLSQQFRHLLVSALPDEKMCHIYLQLLYSFPQISIYDFAIPHLCRHGLFGTAIKWHEKLIRRGDCPSDARNAEPVLRYLEMNGDHTRAKEYTRLMVEAGVSFASYREPNVMVPSFISRDILLPPISNTSDTPGKTPSDDFCARLFATQLFSIDTVIGSLVFLSARDIGPQALREMAARELGNNPYHEALRARLDQLEENSISTGDSTFSILVRKFTAQRNDDLLRSVITCDLHADSFEDHDLQESLLPRYQKQGDHVAFMRTITALLAKTSQHLAEPKRWNCILRAALTNRDLPSIIRTFEKMQELGISVESRSVMRMRRTMLSPRKAGRRPISTKELDWLIHVWRSVLCSGTFIPPKAWTDILRRLGMTGQLHAFEDLALWLAEWYSSPKLRASKQCMTGRPPQSTETVHHPLMAIDVKPADPLHPFQKLFPRTLQQGIIAWGFQHANLNRKSEEGKLDWTWGLSLLRTLSSTHKVHISNPDVVRALKLRLVALFGEAGGSQRKINNATAQHNLASAHEYVEKAEQIWGRSLFKGVDIVSMLERQKKVKNEESRRVGGWTIQDESDETTARGSGRFLYY